MVFFLYFSQIVIKTDFGIQVKFDGVYNAEVNIADFYSGK